MLVSDCGGGTNFRLHFNLGSLTLSVDFRLFALGDCYIYSAMLRNFPISHASRHWLGDPASRTLAAYFSSAFPIPSPPPPTPHWLCFFGHTYI